TAKMDAGMRMRNLKRNPKTPPIKRKSAVISISPSPDCIRSEQQSCGIGRLFGKDGETSRLCTAVCVNLTRCQRTLEVLPTPCMPVVTEIESLQLFFETF